MKAIFRANLTLGPVRRAAAFFAFLTFFLLSSCGEDPESPAAIMDKQASVFREMATVLNQVAEGGDPDLAAKELIRLGTELKELKIKMAAIDDLKESGREELLDLNEFSEATAAWQKARNNLVRSGRFTPELQRALMAHHNPAPMPGEGSSE